ncbi:uncharacterized protein [Argopecten irradians]|uniref:uncharacterized protein n=1 Tax=Argopecten irradians TaxID=31199 RepID=UPI0037153B23
MISLFFSGYDSYSSYRKHQPTNDTLFQDINQIPTKKIIKRKPWKNDVILSHVASPKSRSKRNKRRQTKKKKGSRWNSQQLTPQTNDRRRRRNVVHHTLGSPEEVSTCRNEQVKCLGHPYSTSTYNKESEDIASLAQASFHNTPVPCTANVHVYDHSKRLLSIEVDNNNVFQSINTCLKYNHILPPDNMMVIMYNGKAISEDWQPQMENEDNIHVCVKGKGGMQNTATYREDTESTPGNKEEGARSRETTNRHHHRTLASTSDGYQKPMKDLPDSEYSTMDSIRSTFAQTPMHTLDYDKLASTLLNKMREPRIFHKGYNPVTSLLEEVSEGREDVVHVSGALTEDQAGAFPKDENYKANVQVTDTPQFASTFSQDAEGN